MRRGLTESTLADVCSLVTDGTHDTPKRVASGYPLIKAKEIFGGRIDFDTCDQISEVEHRKVIARSKPEFGDTLFTHIGASLGAAAFVNSSRQFSIKNIALFKPNPAIIDSRYLYYLVVSPEFQALAIRTKTGSAQPFLGLSQLRGHRIQYHSELPAQQYIAGILSAYDELIENSQRRIRILESMARTIYREWFSYFRFPGHEDHPLVASSFGDIPKGWKATTLGLHLALLESGKRPKGGIREEADGVPSIGAENINGIGRHEFGSEKLVPREFFEIMRKGVVRDRDVAIYKDGAYIGKSSYFRDGFPHTECCVNEHVFLLRGDEIRLRQNFLYLWLQEPDTVQAIRSKNANAAQPGINQQTICGMELVLPDEETAAHFDRLVEPQLAEIINLAKRIRILRRTRDLLLPRLLSGQIDIEAA